jgi:hypothetical protein
MSPLFGSRATLGLSMRPVFPKFSANWRAPGVPASACAERVHDPASTPASTGVVDEDDAGPVVAEEADTVVVVEDEDREDDASVGVEDVEMVDEPPDGEDEVANWLDAVEVERVEEPVDGEEPLAGPDNEVDVTVEPLDDAAHWQAP